MKLNVLTDSWINEGMIYLFNIYKFRSVDASENRFLFTSPLKERQSELLTKYPIKKVKNMNAYMSQPEMSKTIMREK